MSKLTLKHCISGLLILTLVVIAMTALSSSDDRHTISVHFEDVDGNGKEEKITHYYKSSKTSLDTFLRIDDRNNIFGFNTYETILEKSEVPISIFQDNLNGKIIGFINIGINKGIVVQTSTKGSGGFTGYKVIALKDGKYQVIYDVLQLNHGKISANVNTIYEETDFPILDDPNCCSTYKKYREISFDSELNPTIIETLKPVDYDAHSAFSKLLDRYPYLYTFKNNETFVPQTYYKSYDMGNGKQTNLAFSEFKLPSWSGVSLVIVENTNEVTKEMLALPYSSKRGRWQEIFIENMGKTVKITGDIGKIGCNGYDCRIPWTDFYDFDEITGRYNLANNKHTDYYKELVKKYNEINESTCIKDSNGKVDRNLTNLFPLRTGQITNFCDDNYGSKSIEYVDVKAFIGSFNVLNKVMGGDNISLFN